MTMAQTKIYLAAPFFTPEQIDMVEVLEKQLAVFNNFEVFSPRKIGGVLKDMKPEKRQATAKEVFESNIYGIHDAEVMLAWVDGYDPGVMVELGIAYEYNIFIIGFTKNPKGMNVMLACLMDTYCENFKELAELLTQLSYIGVSALNRKQGEVTT
jgi:nucleoside 2-deoxyribosyltransferase